MIALSSDMFSLLDAWFSVFGSYRRTVKDRLSIGSLTIYRSSHDQVIFDVRSSDVFLLPGIQALLTHPISRDIRSSTRSAIPITDPRHIRTSSVFLT